MSFTKYDYCNQTVTVNMYYSLQIIYSIMINMIIHSIIKTKLIVRQLRSKLAYPMIKIIKGAKRIGFYHYIIHAYKGWERRKERIR